MEKTFGAGENIREILDDMIAQCRAGSMPLPYVIVLVPANGGVSVARVNQHRNEVKFRQPSAETALMPPIDILFVDASGGTAHFSLSEWERPTTH